MDRSNVTMADWENQLISVGLLVVGKCLSLEQIVIFPPLFAFWQF